MGVKDHQENIQVVGEEEGVGERHLRNQSIGWRGKRSGNERHPKK